jgi:hypothetical protein
MSDQGSEFTPYDDDVSDIDLERKTPSGSIRAKLSDLALDDGKEPVNKKAKRDTESELITAMEDMDEDQIIRLSKEGAKFDLKGDLENIPQRAIAVYIIHSPVVNPVDVNFEMVAELLPELDKKLAWELTRKAHILALKRPFSDDDISFLQDTAKRFKGFRNIGYFGQIRCYASEENANVIVGITDSFFDYIDSHDIGTSSVDDFFALTHLIPTALDIMFDYPIEARAICLVMVLSKAAIEYSPEEIAQAATTVWKLYKGEINAQDCQTFLDGRLIDNDGLSIVRILEKRHPAISQVVEALPALSKTVCSKQPKVQNKDAGDILTGQASINFVKRANLDALPYFRSTSQFCSLLENKVLKINKKLGEGVYGIVSELEVDDYKLPRPVIVKSMIQDIDRPRDLSYYDSFNEVRKHAILSMLNIGGVPILRGFMYCNGETFIIMDQIKGITFKQYEEERREVSAKTGKSTALERGEVMFQLLYYLHAYGKACNFTHFDLHSQNVLLEKVEPADVEYNVNGEIYRVHNHGYKVWIIDFGFSRLVYKGTTIRMMTDHSNAGVDDRFNPTYDLIRIRDSTATYHLSYSELLKNVEPDYVHFYKGRKIVLAGDVIKEMYFRNKTGEQRPEKNFLLEAQDRMDAGVVQL